MASALTARHIGGAVNYVSVAEYGGAAPELVAAGIAADNAVVAPYFVGLFAAAGRPWRLRRREARRPRDLGDGRRRVIQRPTQTEHRRAGARRRGAGAAALPLTTVGAPRRARAVRTRARLLGGHAPLAVAHAAPRALRPVARRISKQANGRARAPPLAGRTRCVCRNRRRRGFSRERRRALGGLAVATAPRRLGAATRCRRSASLGSPRSPSTTLAVQFCVLAADGGQGQ